MMTGKTPAIASLTKKIRSKHDALLRVSSRAVELAVEVGTLLLEAKSLTRHGEWTRYVEDHFDFSARHASRLMKITEWYQALSEPKRTRVSDLPLRGLLREIDDERPAALTAPSPAAAADMPAAAPIHELSAEEKAVVERIAGPFGAAIATAGELLQKPPARPPSSDINPPPPAVAAACDEAVEAEFRDIDSELEERRVDAISLETLREAFRRVCIEIEQGRMTFSQAAAAIRQIATRIEAAAEGKEGDDE